MQLTESATSLTRVCRCVEARLHGVTEVAALALPLVVLSDFESLHEATLGASIRLSAAAYQLREQRIIVNEAIFYALEPDVAEAVLAHEIGHAVCHRDATMERTPAYRFLSECIVADLLACRWSFLDGLRKERLQIYGPEYCEILDLWRDPDQFINRMCTWYQRRLAGLR